MKKLIVILVGALLVWLQVTPKGAALESGRAACAQCECSGQTCDASCCPQQSEPPPLPLQPPPQRTTVQNDLALLFALAAWEPMLADGGRLSLPPLSASMQFGSAVPLFQRHCALLI